MTNAWDRWTSVGSLLTIQIASTDTYLLVGFLAGRVGQVRRGKSQNDNWYGLKINGKEGRARPRPVPIANTMSGARQKIVQARLKNSSSRSSAAIGSSSTFNDRTFSKEPRSAFPHVQQHTHRPITSFIQRALSILGWLRNPTIIQWEALPSSRCRLLIRIPCVSQFRGPSRLGATTTNKYMFLKSSATPSLDSHYVASRVTPTTVVRFEFVSWKWAHKPISAIEENIGVSFNFFLFILPLHTRYLLILTFPFMLRSILSPLISWCTIPLACEQERPATTSLHTAAICLFNLKLCIIMSNQYRQSVYSIMTYRSSLYVRRDIVYNFLITQYLHG